MSLERRESEREIEIKLKGCNSMSDIRDKCESDAALREGWTKSVEPLQALVSSRFRRLKLKDEPVEVVDPCTLDEIDLLKRHLRELFPALNLHKLQKVHTKKVEEYQRWIEAHCKVSHYVFQIRKCKDPSCCSAPVLSEAEVLPDPVKDESGEHFKVYEEVNGTETTEADRPSPNDKQKKKAQKKQGETRTVEATGSNTEEVESEPVLMEGPKSSDDPRLCTVQNSRCLVSCVECRKPRVIYLRHRLTERQQTSVAVAMSEFDYTCGSVLLPPENPMYKKIMCRSELTCETPVELQHYTSGLGLIDLCAHCATETGEVNADLKKKFKTVLPICKNCKDTGKSAIVQRPYGKN